MSPALNLTLSLCSLLIFWTAAGTTRSTVVISATVANLSDHCVHCALALTLIAESCTTGTGETSVKLPRALCFDHVLQGYLRHFAPQLESSFFFVYKLSTLLQVLLLYKLWLPVLDDPYNLLQKAHWGRVSFFR